MKVPSPSSAGDEFAAFAELQRQRAQQIAQRDHQKALLAAARCGVTITDEVKFRSCLARSGTIIVTDR